MCTIDLTVQVVGTFSCDLKTAISDGKSVVIKCVS